MNQRVILLIEEWRDIIGFEGCYQVSNFGNVRGIDRYVNCGKNGIRLQKGQNLVQSENKKGYLRVRVSKSRKEKYTLSVHRLVAEAFIPNPQKLPQVNHKDGNKKNNCVQNLEWCNNSYNQIHACKTGLNNHSTYDAGRPKKKVAQIDNVTNTVIAIFNSISNAAKETNNHSRLINKVCKGERKHTGGYKWIFATKEMKVGDTID